MEVLIISVGMTWVDSNKMVSRDREEKKNFEYVCFIDE